MKALRGLALACLLVMPAAQAANLAEVLQLALQSDPTLREADANRLAAHESKPLARSVMLPQINLGYSRDYEEDSGTSRQFIATGFVDVPIEQTSDTDFWNIQLTQSVF